MVLLEDVEYLENPEDLLVKKEKEAFACMDNLEEGLDFLAH
jgi:hypothetical protein